MAQGPGLSIDINRMAWFSGPPLFQRLKIEVPPGQVLALLGPSGVGKTTLLRIIAGNERRFEGRVMVGGKTAAEAPVPGYVFQDARLLPWLSAADNLRAVAPELNASRITELFAMVGLAGLQDAWPHTLSGGMQRRLALARALSVNPGLLLLDEPFVSLDRTMVRELQALFLTAFGAGSPTVLLVSHDPEDAAHLADRALVLTGRPAQISADITLPGAAATRSREVIAALSEELALAGAAREPAI